MTRWASTTEHCAPTRPAGLSTLRSVFGKFMTPEVARVVLADPKGFWKKGTRTTVTTLFADVRGFTSFAARVPPEEAVATINAIYATLCEVVRAEQGIVNRFLGDGMLAIFGAPLPLENHASAAARAALRARAHIERLAEAYDGVGRHPLRVGLGLNTGSVVAGCVGTSMRAEYTVIGHAVNVASRLVAVAEPGQILLGVGTAALLEPELEICERGVLDLKGIGPTPVFELLSPSPFRLTAQREP